MQLGITRLIYNKNDIEFVTEFHVYWDTLYIVLQCTGSNTDYIYKTENKNNKNFVKKKIKRNNFVRYSDYCHNKKFFVFFYDLAPKNLFKKYPKTVHIYECSKKCFFLGRKTSKISTF